MTEPIKDKQIGPYRVVMVAACPFPANHGTPGAIRELALFLAKQGHDTHVVTYPIKEDLPVDDLTIHRVKAPAFMKSGGVRIGPSLDRLVYDFLLIWKLISVIRRNNIQIIHAHNYEALLIGTIAKWFTGRPLVYTGVNNMADELPLYRIIRPDGLARALGRFVDYTFPRGADIVMALSDELKNYLIGMGISGERIIVIPPGVDPDMFVNGDGSKVRQRHQIRDDQPVIMYTGALEAFQQLEILFEAMPGVVEKYPQAMLMMVGNIPNPKNQRKFEQLAQELGVEENVSFIKSLALSDLPDYLAAADVAVVPRPTCPGFPVKLLNYMAAGKAIVSAHGSAKTLCHGFNGFVAKDYDSGSLADGINLLISDPELRAIIGKRAKDAIPGTYDWDTIARGTALVYKQMLAGKSLDKTALDGNIKASYLPAFSQDSMPDPNCPHGFLATGPIEYPEF
ncbi:MAG: glycosyltransferase family 4 protein [Magnetococcales bacterium]|nr:glycosyltransferase family 4 protein [Magnetococcales bacterium]